MNAPAMPISAIKIILKDEVTTKLDNIRLLDSHQDVIAGYYHNVGREFIDGLRENVMSEFDAIDDYKKADDFIGKYYRLSLDEWVSSLRE